MTGAPIKQTSSLCIKVFDSDAGIKAKRVVRSGVAANTVSTI